MENPFAPFSGRIHENAILLSATKEFTSWERDIFYSWIPSRIFSINQSESVLHLKLGKQWMLKNFYVLQLFVPILKIIL